MKLSLTKSILAVGILLASTAHAVPRYTLANLGSIQVWASINNAGDMFGAERGGNGIIYRNGQVESLGFPVTGSWEINNRGDVIFAIPTENGMDYKSGAYLPKGGMVQEIPQGSWGATNYAAYPSALNDAGVVIGSGSVGQATRAFVYENGQTRDLGTLGGDTATANAINNTGTIVGSSTTADGRSHAYLYSGGVMEQLAVGISAIPSDINDGGVVVGNWGDHKSDAFWIYENGKVTEVEVAGAYNMAVFGINNAGQIFGRHYEDQGGPRTWIYENGEFNYLPDIVDATGAGYSLSHIMGFNDRGQMLIDSDAPDGSVVTVLLSPVPEPATYATLVIGIGAIAAWRRRQPHAARA